MYQLSRRELGLAIAAIAAVPVRALAQSDDSDLQLTSLPPLPDKLEGLAGEDPLNKNFLDDPALVGTAPPSAEEWATAHQIVTHAPIKTTPFEVAKYFIRVGNGKYDPSWPPYIRAWPKSAPANPLILDFFHKTDTKPSGDGVAWCAAFMNWCLAHARTGRPDAASLTPITHNASSASFRKWGTELYNFQSPKPGQSLASIRKGDIIVFGDANADGEISKFHGHVTFFAGFKGTMALCLGGNQFEGHPVIHAINTKPIPVHGKSLVALSIRTDPCLHA